MKIGIIVAMESEMEQLLKLLDAPAKETANGYDFFSGTVGGRQVTAMKCGIGKVNAAVGVLTMIERFAPDCVINTGIAGGTGADAGVLDVVVATEVAYHDVWCGPGNLRGQVQGLPPRFACAGDMFNLDSILSRREVKRGMIASGDLFVTTAAELAKILEIHPDAVAVDMESGAIAQVCALKCVPFMAVRVVSDTPGIENHLDQYQNFWTIAPQSTFSVLKELIGGLKD